MDLAWSLDNIYTSLDSEEFKNDMKQLEAYIADIKSLEVDKWTDTIDIVSKIEQFLRLNNEYKKIYCKISSYAYLLMNADFENIEAANILDELEDKNSELTEVFVSFSRWLKTIEDLDEVIRRTEYLVEHEFYLKELLLKGKYLLSAKEEAIIAKLKNSGSSAWEKYYMELTAFTTEDITIRGKVESFTLSQLKNMLYDKDSFLRKEAYFKEADLCEGLSKACAKCINGISGEALTIYEAKGYKSPLQKVLINSRMDAETLDTMISAIKESLPVLRKFYEKKAEMLGYKSKLPFYDIYVPISDSNQEVSYAEAKELIISSFQNFSEELASFARKAFEDKWVDAEPRRGKGNFALEVDIFPIQQGRIMANFNGRFIDVSILAHEIGHAYHGSKVYRQTMLNTEYSTPIAETASVFCETILNNQLIEKLPSNEALVILESSISDSLYYLIDFYGRYLFENELLKRRKSGSLSVEELNEIMISCMKQAYGDSIEAETIHPYMWMNKPGYFMAENEFLNFPYSFGVLFSKGLYAEFIKNGQSFVAQYDKFLSATSTNNISDAAKIMGIDVHSIDFWRNSLKLIEKDIEKFRDRGTELLSQVSINRQP
ncbi:M3 family oligoendopeptidase [Clostridium manihotivorum]|uniref:Oligoendopeptidase F n=1 Tax=Clostridium manihotivorum TaxID=2320868 RepID=A0A410DT58_9CLOT|nr:M3 family oligoendopeptidase [Clostridium manihotivorum]QAA32230.1 oligoendopeptidase F [Clostridium manihotivorum]